MEKVIAVLDKSYSILQKIIDTLAAVLLTGMVIVVFSNVISRYFLNSSLAWSEEISRFMMIWLAFFGAVMAYVNDEHLGLDALVKVLPKKISGILAVVADLLVLYILYIIISGGYVIAVSSMTWRSPATETSYGLIYSVVPICGTIMFLQTISKMVSHIKLLGRTFKSRKEDLTC